MKLLSLPPDAAAFAPFGALIQPPQTPGDRRMFSDWLVPVEGMALQFHINHVTPAALPAKLDEVERHPHAAQGRSSSASRTRCGRCARPASCPTSSSPSTRRTCATTSTPAISTASPR